MIDLDKVQREVKAHMEKQGLKQTPMLMFIGAVEEIGEAAHAMLKHEQGIRGLKEQEAYKDKLYDAVGDIVIYLSQLSEEMGWNFENVILSTATKVTHRAYCKDI